MADKVKDVYEIIAEDFSKTRYKVWDKVRNFINSLEPNSLIFDAGTGNGKNMFRKDCNFIGIDFCKKFVDICRKKNLNVIEADIRQIPYDDKKFNHSMSIAVLHHLEKREDRIKAISEIIRITKKKGKILLTVWNKSLLQNEKKAKKIKQIKNGYLISWKNKTSRYYYLYDIDELKQEIIDTQKDIRILESGVEYNNSFVIFEKLN